MAIYCPQGSGTLRQYSPVKPSTAQYSPEQPSTAQSGHNTTLHVSDVKTAASQVDITCGALKEASRSSKAINKRVIIYFRDKNARVFATKMMFLIFMTKCHDLSCYVMICKDMHDKNAANLFY